MVLNSVKNKRFIWFLLVARGGELARGERESLQARFDLASIARGGIQPKVLFEVPAGISRAVEIGQDHGTILVQFGIAGRQSDRRVQIGEARLELAPLVAQHGAASAGLPQ